MCCTKNVSRKKISLSEFSLFMCFEHPQSVPRRSHVNIRCLFHTVSPAWKCSMKKWGKIPWFCLFPIFRSNKSLRGFLCFKIIMIFGTAIKYLHINAKIIFRELVDIKLKTDQKASLSTIDPNLSLSSNPSFEHNDGKLKTEFSTIRMTPI